MHEEWDKCCVVSPLVQIFDLYYLQFFAVFYPLNGRIVVHSRTADKGFGNAIGIMDKSNYDIEVLWHPVTKSQKSKTQQTRNRGYYLNGGFPDDWRYCPPKESTCLLSKFYLKKQPKKQTHTHNNHLVAVSWNWKSNRENIKFLQSATLKDFVPTLRFLIKDSSQFLICWISWKNSHQLIQM